MYGAPTFVTPVTVTLEVSSVYQRSFEIDYLTGLGFDTNDTFVCLVINERKFKCKFASKNLLWIDFMVFFKEATGSKDYKEISNKNRILLVRN